MNRYRKKEISMYKPILFNTEMVEALLIDEPYNKTTTRRSIKGFIPDDAIWGYSALAPKGYISCRGTYSDGEALLYGEKFFKLPYEKGDILYVRETWSFIPCIECRSKEHCEKVPAMYEDNDSVSEGCYIYRAGHAQPNRITWHPSIHMLKTAARICLKVCDVRVERLQDITIDGIRAEGLTSMAVHAGDMDIALQEWQILWNSTIKKSDLALYGWDANPYVWVIEFERKEKQI